MGEVGLSFSSPCSSSKAGSTKLVIKQNGGETGLLLSTINETDKWQRQGIKPGLSRACTPRVP